MYTRPLPWERTVVQTSSRSWQGCTLLSSQVTASAASTTNKPVSEQISTAHPPLRFLVFACGAVNPCNEFKEAFSKEQTLAACPLGRQRLSEDGSASQPITAEEARGGGRRGPGDRL